MLIPILIPIFQYQYKSSNADISVSVYPYLQTVYNQTIENRSKEGNLDSTVSLKTDLPSIKIVLKGPIHIDFVLFIQLQTDGPTN